MRYEVERMPEPAPRRRRAKTIDPELAEVVAKVFLLEAGERVVMHVPVPKDDSRFANNGRTRYERARTLDRIQKRLRDAADAHTPAFKLHITINENKDTGKLIREPDGTIKIWVRPGKTRSQLAAQKEK